MRSNLISLPHLSGPIGDQGELHFIDLKDSTIQDNANKAIHDILNNQDWENKAKAKGEDLQKA
jgi:hypothetical protein